jgi:hypothetical protein
MGVDQVRMARQPQCSVCGRLRADQGRPASG